MWGVLAVTESQTVEALLAELNRWRIRAARGTGKARVTLRDLASASGVPRSSLADYLSGKSTMPADVFDAVVQALGATPAEAGVWATAWEEATADRLRPAPEATALALRQLPADVTSFTGRHSHLDALGGVVEASDGPADPATVITGMAGVGKTALAVHWAHRVADRFHDGQLYMNMHGYDPGRPRDPAAAQEEILRALGIADIPRDTEARTALYRSALAGRSLLLVLDNAQSADQVRPLLPGAPGCLVLVTSRGTLTGLVARDGARRLELPPLSLEESTELLETLVGERRTRDAPDACARLHRLCAGLPLALRVAAERMARFPDAALEDLVAEVEREKLDALETDDGETDVRIVFSWSYQALSEPVAELFALLGLHPGPDIDAHATAALAQLTPAEARRKLNALVQVNLLGEPRPGRFSLHDLLRAYATERAAADLARDRAASARIALLEHYRSGAAAAMRLLDPGAAGQRPQSAPPNAVHVALAGTEAARSWLAAEHANLLTCADHAAEHGPPAYTSTLSAILGPHLMNVGHYLDALTLHAGALRAVGTDDSGRADALDSMGVIYLKLGRYPEAADHHERALALLARIGDRIGEARSLNQLGNIHLWTGRYAEAVDSYRQALAVQRNIGDRAGQTRTLGNLGAAYQRLHRFAEAVDHLERAHVLAREFGDRVGEANAVGNLGIVYGKMRRFGDAVEQHRRALRIQEEIGDQTGKIRTLTNLGDACMLAGRFQEAVDHSEQACAMAREIGGRPSEARALINLGTARHRLHQDSQAIEHLEQALELTRELGDQLGEAYASFGLGSAYRAIAREATAIEHLANALDLARRLGDPTLESQTIEALGAISANAQ